MTAVMAALTEQRLGELFAAVREVTGDPRPRVNIATKNAGSEAMLSFDWNDLNGGARHFFARMNTDETLACMGDDDDAYVKWSTRVLDSIRALVLAAKEGEAGPEPSLEQRSRAATDALTSMLAKRKLDAALGQDPDAK